ncbi:alpha/beta-hydrolase superfamily protein [Forsythia ovata]|uniref:Alpha/beta-hydrolase superfamily protein n=1 Tax=Forsythia ovata TaxID=205694 RepID=A0ABD1V198_9LAMI
MMDPARRSILELAFVFSNDTFFIFEQVVITVATPSSVMQSQAAITDSSISIPTFGTRSEASKQIPLRFVQGFCVSPRSVEKISILCDRLGLLHCDFNFLIERVRRTVRGSADDIGWLQRAAEMPPVEDGIERFMEILDDIRHGLHKLPNTMVYLLVPGLFSNHGPLYFTIQKQHSLSGTMQASVDKNAKEIKDYIEEIYWGSGKRVLLLWHSKRGVDSATALSMYWNELKDKVASLALAQSPYGGSPIASDILREGQLGDYVNIRKLMEILFLK